MSFLSTSLDLSTKGIFPNHPNPEEDPKCRKIATLVQLRICKVPRVFSQEMVLKLAKKIEKLVEEGSQSETYNQKEIL